MNTMSSKAHPQVDPIAEVVQRVCEWLGTRNTAAMLGVDSSTVYRWKTGKKFPSRSESETTLRTLYAVCETLSDLPDVQIRSWFLTPNRLLDYRTPESVVTADAGAVLRAADLAAHQGGAPSSGGGVA